MRHYVRAFWATNYERMAVAQAKSKGHVDRTDGKEHSSHNVLTARSSVAKRLRWSTEAVVALRLQPPLLRD